MTSHLSYSTCQRYRFVLSPRRLTTNHRMGKRWRSGEPLPPLGPRSLPRSASAYPFPFPSSISSSETAPASFVARLLPSLFSPPLPWHPAHLWLSASAPPPCCPTAIMRSAHPITSNASLPSRWPHASTSTPI